MSGKNTYTKLGYLGEHLLWGLFSMICYRSLFFRSLPSLSAGQSRLFLWVLVAVLLPAGVLLSFRRHRNTANLTATLLIPYELYTAFSLGRFFRLGLWLSAGFAAALSTVLTVWVLRAPAGPRRRSPDRRIRAGQIAVNCRGAAALCMTPVLLFALATQINGGIPLGTDVRRAADDALDSATIANHMETLLCLQPDQWDACSLAERLSVLQVVADIESRYLGLPQGLTVRTDLLGDSTLGTYSYTACRITIDTEHLENDPPEEVLDSVAHECYHAYQRFLVDLYLDNDEQFRSLQIFRPVRDYAEDFANYTDGQDTDEAALSYYYQTVEISARAYAREAVTDYYDRISEYLSETAH